MIKMMRISRMMRMMRRMRRMRRIRRMRRMRMMRMIRMMRMMRMVKDVEEDDYQGLSLSVALVGLRLARTFLCLFNVGSATLLPTEDRPPCAW